MLVSRPCSAMMRSNSARVSALACSYSTRGMRAMLELQGDCRRSHRFAVARCDGDNMVAHYGVKSTAQSGADCQALWDREVEELLS